MFSLINIKKPITFVLASTNHGMMIINKNDYREYKYAVEEITIASNLKDMLLNIKAIGNDIYQNTSKYTGSIMIEPMTVATNN